MSHCQNMKYQNYISAKVYIFRDWEITDFQMPDKTSNTIKYLPDILKIHQASCIVATFDLHQYSFCKVNIYCVNKPCTIVFYYFFIPFTAKSFHKRRINLNTSTLLIKRGDNKYFPVRKVLIFF